MNEAEDIEADAGPQEKPDRFHQIFERRRKAEMFSRVLGRWCGSIDLQGTPAADFLHELGAVPPYSSALRYHPYIFHPQLGCRLPAMLAAVTPIDAPNNIEALVSIFFDPHTARALRLANGGLFGASKNGVVTLDPFTDALVLGRRIETAEAAGVLLGLPAVATLNADKMERLTVPASVRRAVIAVNEYGRRLHALNLAARLEASGVSVTVADPPDGAPDWATAARERARHA